MSGWRRPASAAAVLALAFAATFALRPWSDERVSDLFVYRTEAAATLDGGLPYRDVFFEYPPLAAPVVAVPGVIGTDGQSYRLAFAGLALLLLAAAVVLAGGLAARTGGEPGPAMLVAAAAPLLTGAMVRTHFDLAPVALTLGALLLLCVGRPRTGMAVLGLAVMTKGFPLVVAPVALAWLTSRGERRVALESGAALVGVIALVGAAALAISAGGSLHALRYQLERPVQVESVPATAVNGLAHLGLGEVRPVASHRSDGLEHPAAGALSIASGLVMAAAIGLLTAAAARRSDPRRLVLTSLAAVTAFATLGRVLSPQYMIWLVPLAALAVAWGMRALAAATLGAIAITLAWFPGHYFDLVARAPLPLVEVAVRNALLLCVLALAFRELALSPRASAAGVLRWPARRSRPRPAPR